MMDNYEHYITKNIRAYYKKRLPAPILYLILLAVLWFSFSLSDKLSPPPLAESVSFEEAYSHGQYYGAAQFSNLHFTGYTKEYLGRTQGYYYYCLRDGKCAIVLLKPSTCEEGLPVMEELSTYGKIVPGKKHFQELLIQLAEDLDWTPDGIQSEISPYYFSEPDYHTFAAFILYAVYFGTFLYAAVSLLLYLAFIRLPFLAPACQNLIVFGNSRQILEEAEEELATLPQLATEDMFITEHYFILTSPYANAIIPIQEILWIYKHSTLHKFLWYHFSISYTLHISANKHVYLHVPKNTKSDIDGIIDYLAEANHNILVGFNEENRLKVQAVQGKPLHIEKLYAFLRQKV